MNIGHSALPQRLPEFTHRDVGIFVVLHYVSGDYVTLGSLELHVESLGMGQVGHPLEEVFTIKGIHEAPPVDQEPARSLLVGDSVAQQGRNPRP